MGLDVGLVVTTSIAVLLWLIVSEQPIWLALAVAGVIGLVLLDGFDITQRTLEATPFSTSARYALIIIPMFILMGIAASRAGLAEDIYSIAERVTRSLPGGLGIATILACGGFAAVTGSSVATVATVGRIGIAQMRKHGYRADAAAALVAAGGTLGVLIPPSVILVVYAILTGESIGRLLLAGLIPGLVSILMYSLGIVYLYKRGRLLQSTTETTLPQEGIGTAGEPAGAPGEPEVLEYGPSHRQASQSELLAEDHRLGSAEANAVGSIAGTAGHDEGERRITWRNVAGAFYVAVILVVILGGIYTGIFTATESGAIAAFVALGIAVIRLGRRPRTMLAELMATFRETASLSSMIFALLVGGAIFAFFLVSGGLPSQLANWVIQLDVPPLVVVLLVLAVMIPLGMFLDSFSIMVIVIPLTYPAVTALGFDGIWFGILVVKVMELGLITPPVGLNIFVVSSTVPDLEPEGVFREILPFGVMDLVTVAILVAMPWLVTWLPEVAYGV